MAQRLDGPVALRAMNLKTDAELVLDALLHAGALTAEQHQKAVAKLQDDLAEIAMEQATAEGALEHHRQFFG